MMWLARGNPPLCSLNQHCSHWARMYLKYCLCSGRDGIALTLGLISVFSWGVAEVPQIITNYEQKSTEGLSLAFLTTWIIGDIFNLAGCLLEPATLPTQFYMALLYTVTTVILTAQTIYYSHIYPRLKANKFIEHHKDQNLHRDESVREEKHRGSSSNDHDDGCRPVKEGIQVSSSPIPVAASAIYHHGSVGRELYYMSARSLSKSPLPVVGSWLAHSRHVGLTPTTTIEDQGTAREPLLTRLVPTQSAPPSDTRNMLCVIASAVCFLGSFSFQLSGNRPFDASRPGMVILVGRKLLQDKVVAAAIIEDGESSNGIGTLLGWAMAVIYMGGRLPQIWLNIKRGNVEGLNPLMFIFALLGNATYVGSILVKSLAWSRTKPNLPWLVDAGGCVLLDAFIIIQFVYYRYWRSEAIGKREGDSVPVS